MRNPLNYLEYHLVILGSQVSPQHLAAGGSP